MGSGKWEQNKNLWNYSPLERLYLSLHLKKFKKRLSSQKRFSDLRVISAGNLSAGGTGKTPAVSFLAHHFRNCNPMVVLRGYGGSLSRDGALVSDGKQVFESSSKVGDEAILMSRIPGLRVAIGKDRPAVIEQYRTPETRMVILDDAFQNPSVFRDHDLVLIDATVPFKKLKLIPMGTFREGPEALSRADTVLFTRVDLAPQSNLLQWKNLVQDFTDAPIYESSHSFSGLSGDFSSIRPGAFCGIGNPDSFFQMLEDFGYPLKARVRYPDHYRFRTRDLEKMIKDHPVDTWITTAKDEVRLREVVLPASFQYEVAEISLKIHGNGERTEGEFLTRVRGNLEC